jgi:hypothetical protein
MINNSNHPYLSLINLSSEKTIEAQIVLALQMAMEDSDPVTQDEMYTFLDDELGGSWDDEDIHWFLTEHHGIIHKYESTDEFFRNMRCDSVWDDGASRLPWMFELFDVEMDY